MKVCKYSLFGNPIIDSLEVYMIWSVKIYIGNFDAIKFSSSKSYKNSNHPKNELILTKNCLFALNELLFLIFIKNTCEKNLHIDVSLSFTSIFFVDKSWLSLFLKQKASLLLVT